VRWQLANLYEHRRHAPRDEQVASWYRGQLFYLLSERFGRPTPQRCGLSGQPLSILQPTQLKSKELEEEVTVLPDCLCVFKTKALQRCDPSHRSKRSAWAIVCRQVSPAGYGDGERSWQREPMRRSALSSVVQRPNACPTCDRCSAEPHQVLQAGESLIDISKVMFKIRQGPFG
jgi:hypothetical protein